MKRLILILFAGMLGGCAAQNFITFDPRPTKNAIELPVLNAKQDSAIFIWLPPAFTEEFVHYSSAFTDDANEYFTKAGVANKHQVAQAMFNDRANALGGIFDGRTGRLNKDILNQTIKNTAIGIFDAYSNVQTILFITPFKESVRVENGLAIWSNTEQKEMIPTVGRKTTKTAISFKLNYLSRDFLQNGVPQFHNIGLDMQDERWADKNKYRHIVKHIFEPLIKPKA